MRVNKLQSAAQEAPASFSSLSALVQALAFAVMKWQAEQVKRSVLAALSQCPPWAPGIPLGAEADISETMAGAI